MTKHRGKFVWYELMTTDPKAAESFYRSVIGWGAQDAGAPGMSYTLFTVGETPAGGMMALPEGAAAAGMGPAWTGYVGVDDVDAHASRVKHDGGTIHRKPDDIPGIGRFAFVSDPQGAAFALFKGTREEPPPAPPPGTPGHAGWRELHANDREAAFAFYAKHFGWTKADAVDMGPMGIYQLFSGGSETLGGMMTSAVAPKPFWLYYFNVAGIDAAADRVKAGGGKTINGPHQVPGGSWIVNCLDPQGAMFAMVGPRS